MVRSLNSYDTVVVNADTSLSGSGTSGATGSSFSAHDTRIVSGHNNMKMPDEIDKIFFIICFFGCFCKITQYMRPQQVSSVAKALQFVFS